MQAPTGHCESEMQAPTGHCESEMQAPIGHCESEMQAPTGHCEDVPCQGCFQTALIALDASEAALKGCTHCLGCFRGFTQVLHSLLKPTHLAESTMHLTHGVMHAGRPACNHCLQCRNAHRPSSMLSLPAVPQCRPDVQQVIIAWSELFTTQYLVHQELEGGRQELGRVRA